MACGLLHTVFGCKAAFVLLRPRFGERKMRILDMRRMCALTTGLMLVSLPAMAGRESTPRDPLQTKLETNVQDYTLREGSFVQALAHVATEFEIPMGIEWIRDPQA